MKDRDYDSGCSEPGGKAAGLPEGNVPHPAGARDSSPWAAKRDASDILARDNNRLSLMISLAAAILPGVLALLLCSFLYAPAASLLEKYSLYNEQIEKIMDGVCGLIIAVASYPALAGMLAAAGGAVRGEERVGRNAIAPCRRLFRTWSVGLISAIPAGVAWGSAALTRTLFGLLSDIETGWITLLYLAVFALGLLMLAAALILFLRGFFFAGLALRGDLSIPAALKLAFAASRGRMRQIAGYIFSFTGWAILSVISVGVLFVIELAPKFSVSYMLWCDRASAGCRGSRQIIKKKEKL